MLAYSGANLLLPSRSAHFVVVFEALLSTVHKRDPCLVFKKTVFENHWLSVEEIARYLGISSDSVYKWIDKHGMPANQIGHISRFKRDKIGNWLQAVSAVQKIKQDKAE